MRGVGQALCALALDGRRRRQRPVTKRTTAAAPKDTSSARSTNARASRGENKKKILAALEGGPKTASEIANETGIAAVPSARR